MGPVGDCWLAMMAQWKFLGHMESSVCEIYRRPVEGRHSHLSLVRQPGLTAGVDSQDARYEHLEEESVDTRDNRVDGWVSEDVTAMAVAQMQRLSAKGGVEWRRWSEGTKETRKGSERRGRGRLGVYKLLTSAGAFAKPQGRG